MGEIPTTYQEILPLYQALLAEKESLETKVLYLTEELVKLKKLISGAKSERFVPDENCSQIALGLIPESDEPVTQIQTEQVTYTRKKSKTTHTPHGRSPLPAHLPRKEIIIEPEEDTAGMKRIGQETTEELEYTPPTLHVNRYIRPKYACPDSEGVLVGMLPSRPVEKGKFGPGLLAHLAISKYVDHLPLYRQRKQFLRQKVNLSASTLGDAIRATCELLSPLYERQSKVIRQAGYLMVDETGIRVQDSEIKGKCHHGYFWVYYDPFCPAAFFDYRQTRSRAGPEQMLADFSGYLQTDGYQVYDEFGARKSIIHVACFAHARRYFSDALPNDAVRAEWMLLRIQKLYEVERKAREGGYTHDERYHLRQAEALPVLKKIKEWLDTERQKIVPKSAIGKAIAYMIKYWQRLNVYITDGMLEIDNNPVENAIRPVALGRKNYLFAGSHDGARRAAMIYSLVVTAQLHSLEPFEYMRDVITRLPGHPHKKLDELLPQNWKRHILSPACTEHGRSAEGIEPTNS